MNKLSEKYLWLGVILLFFISSCTEFTPKPKGYFRIEFEKPQYKTLQTDSLPYSFEIEKNTEVQIIESSRNEKWLNLVYPLQNATLYCSYLRVSKADVKNAIKDSYNLVQKQESILSIQEKSYNNSLNKIHGSLFLIKGDCISPIQFHLTDSVNHFFRGSVYYSGKTNSDSIAPVTNYLIQNITHIMETFNWEN